VFPAAQDAFFKRGPARTGAPHAWGAVSSANFCLAGPDGHAAEASDFMSPLHPTTPKLERQQTRKSPAPLLIEGRHDSIDGLMLSSHSTVGMLGTGATLTRMKSTSRFCFAHASGPDIGRCSRRKVGP